MCVCVFQHPNESSVNGMLTGYRLYYRELPVNTSTLSQAEAQATGNNTSVLITSMYVVKGFFLVCLYLFILPHNFHFCAVCTLDY